MQPVDPPGRLDRPPSSEQRASFPSDFGKRFLLFVDTEEEFDWSRPRRRDATATTAISALPEAHHRFSRFGIAPTYLVDYPVADNPASAAILRELAEGGNAVIGAQLHAWVNPPLDEEMSSRNSFAGNLPRDIERAKLKALTERITKAFGSAPTIYRAGRYGIGPNSVDLLIEQGYRLDVSVRPLFDYSNEDGPDFSRFPVWPWWTDPQRMLLELPLGATYAGRLSDLGRRLYPAIAKLPVVPGLLARTGLLQRVALTPEGMPLRDAVRAIERMIDEGVEIFSLSFHSPSVCPGHTPYVRDRAELAVFWRWWDGVLDQFSRHGITPASTPQLIDAVR